MANPEINARILRRLLASGATGRAERLLARMQPADIAPLLSGLTPDEVRTAIELLFRQRRAASVVRELPARAAARGHRRARRPAPGRRDRAARDRRHARAGGRDPGGAARGGAGASAPGQARGAREGGALPAVQRGPRDDDALRGPRREPHRAAGDRPDPRRRRRDRLDLLPLRGRRGRPPARRDPAAPPGLGAARPQRGGADDHGAGATSAPTPTRRRPRSWSRATTCSRSR